MKQPCVYILTNKRNGTLYVGVTSNLIQRIWQHKEALVKGFTENHDIKILVWYELHETMISAIAREKSIKKWNRAWKLRMIEERNPDWQDLWLEITGQAKSSNCPLTFAQDPAPTVCHPEHAILHPEPTARHPAATLRHPREGGDPVLTLNPKELDSRLRGNDGEECNNNEKDCRNNQGDSQ